MAKRYIIESTAPGYMPRVERLRIDCANLALRKAVYAAAEGQALLDRPIAWHAMREANAWTGARITIRIGADTVNAWKEESNNV